MKTTDLKVGDYYAWATGRQMPGKLYKPYRALLLSLDPSHNKTSDNVYVSMNGLSGKLEDHVVLKGHDPRRMGRKIHPRYFCAIETPIYTETEIDPVTGKPWFRHAWDHRGRTEYVESDSLWIPHAALASELRCLWSDVAEQVAQEKHELGLINKHEYERHERQKVIDAEKFEAEKERIRKVTAERNAAQEFFDTRIAPDLADYGVDLDSEVKYNQIGRQVHISAEALARLLQKVKEDVN